MSDSEQVKVADEQSVLEQLRAIDEQYILKKYEERVNYYWKASRNNKNSYKRYRSWTIVRALLKSPPSPLFFPIVRCHITNGTETNLLQILIISASNLHFLKFVSN